MRYLAAGECSRKPVWNYTIIGIIIIIIIIIVIIMCAQELEQKMVLFVGFKSIFTFLSRLDLRLDVNLHTLKNDICLYMSRDICLYMSRDIWVYIQICTRCRLRSFSDLYVTLSRDYLRRLFGFI